jgi:CheY-like chemotaxis protein/predicted regulator of Ras-like GTPase activity (Roadblock/LC7/MglB family)
MMAEKWILIVDDEESILAVVINSLNKHSQEYHAVTVTNGQAALEQIQLRHFDLVVTDFRMAGMDGLQLLGQIQLVSPGTRVILMTAYANSAVEAEASRLNAYRYLTKPFEIDAFLKIVKEAVETGGLNQGGVLVLSEVDYRKLNQIMEQLQKDVGARCVILTDGEGRSIARIGHVEDLPLARIASLLGGSVATLEEAGRTIDSKDDGFNLAYREGKSGNIYAVNIGTQFLLIILIERGPFSSRLGMVWYSAQNAAAALLEGMNNAKYSSPGDVLRGDLEQAMDGELDRLFGGEPAPFNASTGREQLASASKAMETASLLPRQPSPLISFEEAINAGILPSQLQDESFPATRELKEKP